ncbi:Glycerophosphocholine phosphodiesterase GDE1 [Erysiphe neolycopersici]|uniref:Glycerophosphocholine phosphodiesterase GDE1 n=1 Tax=Erysiphe neolycopersici TaxID=212602 RepID=A0A420HR57_9PEZI|nr:Glycerophosphocholine phosphodiesterase GDE1 [Erysiphe neolycopersici]
MKFGQNLARNKVPEWSSNYIDYKGLKKLIQNTLTNTTSNDEADLAKFLFYLDRNLEDVDNFYNKKFADVSRQLKVLGERYGTSREAFNSMDNSESNEIVRVLLELRSQFRNLQWFGDVNRRGFVKITKKLDKRFPDSHTQQPYVVSKVNQKPFSTNVKLLAKIAEINNWLSILGEVKNNEDVSLIHKSNSFKNVSSRKKINLSQSQIEILDQAISNDNFILLRDTLEEAVTDFNLPEFQILLISLLQRAISCKSKLVIKYFLGKIQSLDESDDLHQRNCLHRFVISIGRAESAKHNVPGLSQISAEDSQYLTPALLPTTGLTTSKPTQTNHQSLDENAKLLHFILESLLPIHRAALVSRDRYGRIPLHYASQLDVAIICQIVMKFMLSWNLINSEDDIDATNLEDDEGLTPLDLSVAGGHVTTTKALLDFRRQVGTCDNENFRSSSNLRINRLIAAATKFNFTAIVELLVKNDSNINWQDAAGETALHIAARFGHLECAEILFKCKNQMIDVELTEKSFSWTPLHVASVDGHLPIVELLIQKGANPNKLDASGWTAKEHAALRGHMDIARRLIDVTSDLEITNLSIKNSISNATGLDVPALSSIESSRSIDSGLHSTKHTKSFGHRYLTNESLVLVNLGTMDMRKNILAVQLEKIPIDEAHLTQLDTALSIIISAENAKGEPVIIDLPLEDSVSMEPIVFTAIDAAKIKLCFDIVPRYSGRQKDKLGRGVALLSSFKQATGAKRVDLQGDVSVPILGTSLDIIGAINFNFLVIKPFSHPNISITTKQTYWKEVSSTMVIGHRGLGKNLTSNKSLQLGENTLQSFIAAANLGANYVEFDVQLTKDHIPVIYHDFLVSETGIDAPVHTLTLEQFLHVNDAIPHAQRSYTPPNETSSNDYPRVARSSDRQRSLSLNLSVSEYIMSERMKHTRDFKLKGFKANSRGNFIQAPFTTLEEMFLKLPEHVGFNIEMKYPMLHELEVHDMDGYTVELNNFVDAVLTKVYDLGKKRKIIFSSFNPDVCLMLNFKQPSIPILFLTDAGVSAVSDIRASSLHEAIRFARRWNLLGIVSAAEPLCNSPRLVKVVKENGLVCVSYGLLNNDPLKVQKQVDEGIDAVIVDSVLKIRNRLTKNVTKTSGVTLD